MIQHKHDRFDTVILYGVIILLLVLCSVSAETMRSTVCTVTVQNGWAVNYTKQRKIFYMANLIWLVYSGGAASPYTLKFAGMQK